MDPDEKWDELLDALERGQVEDAGLCAEELARLVQDGAQVDGLAAARQRSRS